MRCRIVEAGSLQLSAPKTTTGQQSSQTAKTEQKTQKIRPNRRIFCEKWSEWGDSNSRHLAPKASALPTALHPVMNFSNCGQTCGQRRFLTSYRRGEKCCQPRCPRAFRVFRELRLEPVPHAPKLRAVLFRKILPAFRSLHRVPDGRLCPSLFYRNILQSQGEPFQQLLPRLRLRRSPGRAPAE